jgi:recombination protein RecR
MDPIQRLTELFEKFPGIGPRQAGRFVQYLLRSAPAIRRELADSVQLLAQSARQCTSCMRFHGEKGKVCSLCANSARDTALLTVVASDADLAALERSGTYSGYYFVLGGTISLASEKMTGLRHKQLLDGLQERIQKGLQEVILAFPANPEGDATAIRLKEEIGRKYADLRITTLGRGLSTGSELEYADAETLKNALAGRK